ncbi:MAG: hypothetical protein IPG56_16755 [Caulobacteraceae bacterium]|nr:hypothetical protein [Caulobacteraceae bacterium]
MWVQAVGTWEMKGNWKRCAVALAAFWMLGAASASADGPQQAELHIWAGNEADDSGSFGLRSVEAAWWATERDRFGVRYDNSLSLDNPTLARAGVDAEGYFLSYMHDFDGRFLLTGEIGQRDLPGDAEQDIYKVEGVIFREGDAIKLGAQVSPTEDPIDDYTDTVVWGAYNFAVGDEWRVEPALYVSQSGAAEDNEWRAAVYAEYNPPSEAWQVGVGAGYGDIDSDIPGASGSVFNAHARMSFAVFEHHSVHFQVRYEDAPLTNYTTALVGVSFRLPRS